VGYLWANFSLPRPFCSRGRSDVRDRQTDRRQTKASLNASALWRNTNTDSPTNISFCLLYAFVLIIMWYNVIIDFFTPKSEAYTVKLGQSQVLDIFRHSVWDPKLCDGSMSLKASHYTLYCSVQSHSRCSRSGDHCFQSAAAPLWNRLHPPPRQPNVIYRQFTKDS